MQCITACPMEDTNLNSLPGTQHGENAITISMIQTETD